MIVYASATQNENHSWQPCFFFQSGQKMSKLCKGPSIMLSVKFGFIWLRDFKGENENVNVYGQPTASDNSSHILWPGEIGKMLKPQV